MKEQVGTRAVDGMTSGSKDCDLRFVMIWENVINSSTFHVFTVYPVYTSCNAVVDKAVHQIQVAKETREKVTDARFKFVGCKNEGEQRSW
jgi:hypothetical protein